MKRFITMVALGLSILGVGLVSQLAARAQDATPAAGRPSAGFDLHIDAKLHFPGDPETIAHHYCKPVARGMIECLLYASDAPDAPVVGVEVIVDAATWAMFGPEEQALWHYHREEIPLVDA